MPSAASPAKLAATKKASTSKKAAGKKVKTSKPKPATKQPAVKQSKTVKKAGLTGKKTSKPKAVAKPQAAKKKAAKAPKAKAAEAVTAAAKGPASLLDEFYAAHQHLRMPVVFFTFSEDALEEDNRYASKVGGHPFWPASQAWGKNTMGSLRLFMQINLAEVPSNHGIAGMPTDGIFQIFWNDFQDAFSADENDVQGPDTFVIRYWSVEEVARASSEEKLLSTDALPSLEDDNLMMGLDPTTPYGIEFRKPTKMFATHCDYRFKAALSEWVTQRNFDSEVIEGLDDEANDRQSKEDRGDGLLGGSPRFFNGDDLRHLDDPEPYELLLQVESAGPLQFGDCGRESFFIHPARLAARDFSRVLFFHDE